MDKKFSDLLKIVRSAKEGDEKSKEEIIKRFQPLTNKKIKNVHLKNYDLEDLHQEADRFILIAINKFNIEKSSNFPSYVKYTLFNNFNYLVRRKSRYEKETSLNKENDEGCELIEMVADNIDIENAFMTKEQNFELSSAIGKLPLDDQDMIDCVFFKGWRINRYAKYRDIDSRAAYRKGANILKKLRKMLE